MRFRREAELRIDWTCEALSLTLSVRLLDVVALAVALVACLETHARAEGRPRAAVLIDTEEINRRPNMVGLSWLDYLEAKSAMLKGQEPQARDWTFEEERNARDLLAKAWMARKPSMQVDRYLDALGDVSTAGFMSEYVWTFLRKESWGQPAGLRLTEFESWASLHLADHRLETLVDLDVSGRRE